MAQPPANVSTSSTAGKLVVLALFGMGITLAGFGWWWNLRQNQRVEKLWGHEQVRLIRQAPRVELTELIPASESEGAAETTRLGEQTYVVSEGLDISEARGLVHARYALTEDASYEWPGSASSQENSESRQRQWRLRFVDGEKVATLVIDPASHAVRLEPAGQEAIAIPRIIEGWRRLAERELKWPATK